MLIPRSLGRFWQKVLIRGEDECWDWLGSTNDYGYGKLRIDGKEQKAHRISYAININDPGSLFVLHSCDNRQCVNPKHLFLGTHQDNMTDRVKKGRNGKNSKLSELQVKEIKDKWKTHTYLQKDLALEYGVSKRHVCRIVRDWSKQWAN